MVFLLEGARLRGLLGGTWGSCQFFSPDVWQHLGADALLGQQLEQYGVRLAAVDDGGPGDPTADRVEAGLHLRDHPLARPGRISASASGLISPITSSELGQSMKSPSTSVRTSSFSAASATARAAAAEPA